MNEQIKDQIRASNEALTTAIESGDIEEWRLFRSIRNQVSKVIKYFKSEYYIAMINKTKTMWKAMKLVTNNDDSSLPRRVIVEGQTITSPKTITNKCNEFFRDKILFVKI